MINKYLIIAVTAFATVFAISSCNTGTPDDKNGYAADSATIAAGAATFNQNCSGCHNFKQDGIGPQLSGVTDRLPKEWMLHFIKN